MDPQPHARLLSRPARRLGLAGLVLAAACGSAPEAPPTALPALAGPVSLLRLPRAGGQATAYLPEGLAPAGWVSTGRLAPLRRPLGADLDERLAFAVDTGGGLVALDLETRGVRTSLLRGISNAVVAGDGSLYAIDDQRRVTHLLRRAPTRYREPLPAPPRHLFGALIDRLVVVTAGESPELLVVTADAVSEGIAAPEGEAAATLWGDLVAIAADTAVVVFDTHLRERRASLRLGGGIRSVAFSPSGHRLYVARNRGDLLVLDRFTLEQLAAIDLPGPVETVRPDATGRWVLLRPEALDSVWVVDATSNRVVARVAGGWGADLPLVAGAATLVVRQGNDVQGWDLTQTNATLTGVVDGAGSDFWTLLAWVPPARATEAAAAIEEASAAQDSALVLGLTVAPLTGPEPAVYLQVSSSQNPGWARELARQLSAAGHPAGVRDPVTGEDGYRVVLGPYPSREAAEEAGRQLGRPYFVLVDPPTSRPR